MCGTPATRRSHNGEQKKRKKVVRIQQWAARLATSAWMGKQRKMEKRGHYVAVKQVTKKKAIKLTIGVASIQASVNVSGAFKPSWDIFANAWKLIGEIREGLAQNRDAENGVGSMKGFSPDTNSASRRPDTGPRVRPLDP